MGTYNSIWYIEIPVGVLQMPLDHVDVYEAKGWKSPLRSTFFAPFRCKICTNRISDVLMISVYQGMFTGATKAEYTFVHKTCLDVVWRAWENNKAHDLDQEIRGIAFCYGYSMNKIDLSCW